MGIEILDSLEFLKARSEFSADVIFCDPPYGLGSEVIIRPDGKPDYSKAADFMSKWDMPTGKYWEDWFKEAYRTLKHGGYCVMYGMDRQLLLFKYYAALAGFSERQSLYWYFISNFPKASDLSKNLDKNAGAEREKVLVATKQGNSERRGEGEQGVSYGDSTGGFTDKSVPITPLAKKYDGYKYSVSPLKQTNETIMVFQKPYKTGSCLHDTLAYENGDKTCCCGALAINQNRCGCVKPFNARAANDGNESVPVIHSNDEYQGQEVEGRYPAQTFVSPEAGEVLDRQSGISKGAKGGIRKAGSEFGQGSGWNAHENRDSIRIGFEDEAGCSKILHKCAYEEGEMDLYMYCPKVSKQERNQGCEAMEAKPTNTATDTGLKANGDGTPRNQSATMTNFHPCAKPISLNERILRLFKTPNPQKILYPFAGSGSEVIGGIRAGFTDWEGCELNPEYVTIAEARIKHWSEKPAQEKLWK